MRGEATRGGTSLGVSPWGYRMLRLLILPGPSSQSWTESFKTMNKNGPFSSLTCTLVFRPQGHKRVNEEEEKLLGGLCGINTKGGEREGAVLLPWPRMLQGGTALCSGAFLWVQGFPPVLPHSPESSSLSPAASIYQFLVLSFQIQGSLPNSGLPRA